MTKFFCANPLDSATSAPFAPCWLHRPAPDTGSISGTARRGWCFARPEHSVMILGPPRSGKTSSLIIPNVLASNGPVVSTSTKPDVLDATVGARSGLGRCLLFDPTGSVDRPTGRAARCGGRRCSRARTWTGALSMARSLVEVGSASARAARPGRRLPLDRTGPGAAGPPAARRRPRRRRHAHPSDLGRSPPSPAGAADPGRRSRAVHRASARNLLDGIVATDERELSGIWSTASGALTGFRSDDRPWRPPPTPISTRTGSSAPRTPSTSPRPPTDRHWWHPWWWGSSTTSAKPPTPAAPTAVADGIVGPAGGPGPRRGGQHRPHPRSAVDDQRGRRPGAGHAGVPAGPLPGPAPVARSSRRVPLAVRHHRGASRASGTSERSRPCPLWPATRSCRPARCRSVGPSPITRWPTC